MSAAFAAARSLIYASGFFLLWGWLALGVRPLDQNFAVAMPTWFRSAGIIVMSVGFVLALGCVMVFVFRGRGTPAPFDPPREFVAIGPYRYVRNPMYIGGLTMLLGFGLVHLSLAMLFFTVPAALVAHLFVVLVEERQLEQRFGEPYREYKRSVNRWIPRWRDRTLRPG